MNDKEINIAIAEACPDKFRYENGAWFFQYATNCWSQCHNNSICADLNAMHEAEKTLEGLNNDLYANILCELIKAGKIDTYTQKLGAPQLSWHGVFSVANATARQRAEAFLRTIGK